MLRTYDRGIMVVVVVYRDVLCIREDVQKVVVLVGTNNMRGRGV